MFEKFFYKMMNFVTKYPSRETILQGAAEIEAGLRDDEARLRDRDPGHAETEAHREAAQYCCVLWWDESVGRPDEPVNVSGEQACNKLAERYGAHRRPLVVGPCRQL